MIRLGAAAWLLGISPSLALALELPRQEAVPGGVKIIRLGVHGDAMPYVEADGQRAMVSP